MIPREYRQRVIQWMPRWVRARFQLRRELRALQALPQQECVTGCLRRREEVNLPAMFRSEEIAAGWERAKGAIERLSIPDGTGGVNPGDRRAIYYLVEEFKPSSVLEVGTHIGASTVHVALALTEARPGARTEAALTTVDIADVNSPATRPWLKYGTTRSPREMLDSVGCGSLVEFIASGSLRYMDRCRRKFDFVFLDGDHSAPTVYQEIPAALKLLNPGGVLLLHDYYPGMKPLWSDGGVIPGPFVATERLRKEGAAVTVLSLGNLPWATKLGSNATSLALLLKDG